MSLSVQAGATDPRGYPRQALLPACSPAPEILSPNRVAADTHVAGLLIIKGQEGRLVKSCVASAVAGHPAGDRETEERSQQPGYRPRSRHHGRLTPLPRQPSHPLLYEPVGYLFPGRQGELIRPDSVSHLFRRLNTESGLPPIRLHDRRHGAACLSLAAGNDLKTVQAMLGHSRILLTADTYTSVLPSLARQSAEATARLVLDAARTTGTHLRARRPRKATIRRQVAAVADDTFNTTNCRRTLLLVPKPKGSEPGLNTAPKGPAERRKPLFTASGPR
ncbi:tyrosine-type recombinase/integrase [Amycolatopsis marina]